MHHHFSKTTLSFLLPALTLHTLFFAAPGMAEEESETAAPPEITLTHPVRTGGILPAEGAIEFTITATPPVDDASITVLLNGEDATDRLRREGTPKERALRLEGFDPDTTYTVEVRAANAEGAAELETRVHTYEGTVPGYRGIWFTLGQIQDERYGDKYSGGFAFSWSHTLTPMVVYAPEVNKSFFVYGGTTSPEDNYLLIMASYYDHAKHHVPRPTIVRDQRGVNDPHDNPSITIDDEGHLWVFVAGRGQRRPGQIFRATEPYSVDNFEEIINREQTYSQIWHVPGRGFFHLLTLYTSGRELYWETSEDGRDWTENPTEDLQKLAGFRGHYQVSRVHGEKIGTAFNYHPGGSVDRRTNLYYMQTEDFGETWTTVDGRTLTTPLDDPQNDALVVDYEAEDRLFYITKMLFDEDGHPLILGVTSGGFAPGPDNDPRTWEITRWTGSEWQTRPVLDSDHNYDMGSLYLDGPRWQLIAPALPGPQHYRTGGEVGLWISEDRGDTWRLEREVTRNSPGNHNYVRRATQPRDPFFGVWADGDSSQFSISRLFFTNKDGDKLYMLPYEMDEDFAEPILLDPPTPPDFPARE